MRIHIIRHGEPNYEKDCLTSLGKRQAQAITSLPWIVATERIVSSPLGRARETAEPIAYAIGKKTEILPWLREMDDVVVWDERRPDLAVWNLSCEQLQRVEDGEWIHNKLFVDTKLQNRWNELCVGVDELFAEYSIRRHEKGWIYEGVIEDDIELVISCHLGIGLTLLAYLLGISPITLWRTVYLAPSSVTTLLVERQGDYHVNLRLLQLGDVSHLVHNGISVGTIGLQYNIK